jgi:CRP-like cAMP-binding protein
MNEDANREIEPSARDTGLARALPRLTAEQIEQVSPNLRRESYRSGEEIIRQGEPPDSFYIIIGGKAEVCHENLEGEVEVIDQRLPGEYFGEIGLLKDWPRSATVRAPLDGDVEVLAMGKDDFQELIDRSKGTESHVAMDMIRRLIQLSKHQ